VRPSLAARHCNRAHLLHRCVIAAVSCVALLLGAAESRAQVSPAEVLNPQLRELEKTYLPQLKALNAAVASTKFPFRFLLTRYAGVDPSQQVVADTRGVEFVHFQSRVVLKITGNYIAAYNAAQLTQNERASRVFNEIVLSTLASVEKEIPADVACDAIGFEIAYHVRRAEKNYEYEGKEILVVVFDRADAFGFPGPADKKARQEILNRSQVFVNGQEFGLALGEHDPLNPEELQRSTTGQPPAPTGSSRTGAGVNSRLMTTNPRLLPNNSTPGTPAPGTPGTSGQSSGSNSPVKTEAEETPPPPTATPLQAEQLQAKYQKQLDALAEVGKTKFHFVDYAPPSFVIFQNRVVLQLTLRNTLRFDPATSSIYKRSAQTFDLFLAPQLKDIVDRISSEIDFDGLDFSVLNAVKSAPSSSSEAIEFICSLKALRKFTAAEITNQDLINQSVVMVNGVRIALNLQLVE
jgi:hypothetical protein